MSQFPQESISLLKPLPCMVEEKTKWMAYLPFGGMKGSLQADIKAQGKAIINFYTEPKIITERYWAEQ